MNEPLTCKFDKLVKVLFKQIKHLETELQSYE